VLSKQTTKQRVLPPPASTAEIIEALEASARVSQTVTERLPSIGALVLASAKGTLEGVRGEIRAAQRWVESTSAECTRRIDELKERSAKKRVGEIVAKIATYQERMTRLIDKVEFLSGEKSPHPVKREFLRREELSEVYGSFNELRRAFWVKLFSVPCVAQERIVQLERMLAGELRLNRTIFLKPTDPRSAGEIKGEAEAAVSFYHSFASFGGQTTDSSCSEALGMKLAEIPILPEDALTLAADVERQCEELITRTIERGLSYSVMPRDEDGDRLAVLERNLGGGALQVRGLMQDLRGRREDYLAIKNFLYTINEPLAIALTNRFRGVDADGDDLHQSAKIGLLRGIERFDPRVGTQFSTLAGSWVKQMLYLERRESIVGPHVPGHAIRCLMYLRALPRAELLGLNREEVCSKFEVSPKVLSGLLGLVNRVSSLSAARGGEGNGPATDVADHRAAEPTQAVEAAERRALIEQLMKSLPPREREIIGMRFGIGYSKTHTLREIGHHLGITRERVRQIERQILEESRERLRRGLV
jgi:RNA polymerase primary sigma factor